MTAPHTDAPSPSRQSVNRAFESSDAAQVAALHARAFADSTRPRAEYFEEVYLNRDDDGTAARSLVREEQGEILGFIGVVPRRLRWKDQQVHAACISNLMVDPRNSAPTSGLKLLRDALSGPQELSFSDLSNDAGQAIWLGLRGQTVWAYHSWWSWGEARGSGGSTALRRATARLTGAVRAPGSPAEQAPPARDVVEEDVDAAALVQAMNDTGSDHSLRPDYDVATLAWLLSLLDRKPSLGSLQKVGVFDRTGSMLGWYLYLLRSDGPSRVLQLGGRSTALATVFASLQRHATARGAGVLFGRLEPRLMSCLQPRNDVDVSIGKYSLNIWTRRPELAAAIHAGDAFLSAMEGEWPTAATVEFASA